jgi:uncharacterized protein YceK
MIRIVLLVLIVGCGDIQDTVMGTEEETTAVELDVYMKYEMDSNGYYRVGYNGYSGVVQIALV